MKIWNSLVALRVLSVVLAIALLLAILFCPNETNNKERILQVKEQDSIIDTIYKNNDSIIYSIKWKTSKLDTIYKKYEETNNIILNQSVDSDMLFFTDYIERFRINKYGTVENN